MAYQRIGPLSNLRLTIGPLIINFQKHLAIRAIRDDMIDQLTLRMKKSARSGDNMTLEQWITRMIERIEENERWMAKISGGE